MLPRIVEDIRVKVVPLHAAFKEVEAGAIIGLLLELQLAAVLHELTELTWLAATKLFQGRLNLLLLDGVVLFVL